ncbi:MAG: sodium-translocating pyrophosphatase [Candidatus Micrarchaeia archaeon]
MDNVLMLQIASLIAGLFSLGSAAYLYLKVTKSAKGNQKMNEIADAIRIGAMAYLKRQTETVAKFAAVIFVLFLAVGFFTGESVWYGIAIAFLVGAISSALAGYIGMDITTQANVRTAQAATKGLNASLSMSFTSGVVMGLSVVGLGLTAITLLWMVFGFFIIDGPGAQSVLLQMITGMAFGASLIAMFARVGGGIFTKAADVGADLVGKVEAGIPEDDPRNPAVIADNVGDNVGDCAGMGADLYESYVVTIIATMILGSITFGIAGMVFPLLIASGAILASIVGTYFVKTKENGNPMDALSKGIYATAVLCAFVFYGVATAIIPQGGSVSQMGVFLASLVGLAVAIAIVWMTDYYTSTEKRPVQDIAKSSLTGAGTNVITGVAVGLQSTAPFAVIIVVAIMLAYTFAGIFGVAVAVMAMLSLTGIIVAVDTFGPVADNAGGIAEMAGLEGKVRTVTDKLDAVGNTTKATTKGFAIASAGLAALALLLAFAQEVNAAAAKLGMAGLEITKAGIPVINVMEPSVLVGVLIGGAIPFLFSSFAIMAVGKAAGEIIGEVRRQFKEIKGIMEGKAKPDYAACVDISTKAALKELMVPGLIAVAAPIVVGFVFGPAAVGGLLVGALVTGQFMAVFMSNAGGAWDNAKKYIEQGHHGGKKTPAHAAAIVGDTVGDPFKDTAGPALNPLIKILNTVSILFVGLFVKYALHLI